MTETTSEIEKAVRIGGVLVYKGWSVKLEWDISEIRTKIEELQKMIRELQLPNDEWQAISIMVDIRRHIDNSVDKKLRFYFEEKKIEEDKLSSRRKR